MLSPPPPFCSCECPTSTKCSWFMRCCWIPKLLYVGLLHRESTQLRLWCWLLHTWWLLWRCKRDVSDWILCCGGLQSVLYGWWQLPGNRGVLLWLSLYLLWGLLSRLWSPLPNHFWLRDRLLCSCWLHSVLCWWIRLFRDTSKLQVWCRMQRSWGLLYRHCLNLPPH